MHNFHIFSCNVRGLAAVLHRNNVKDFVRSIQPVAVCLRYTMCSSFNDIAKLIMCVFDTACWVEDPLEGHS